MLESTEDRITDFLDADGNWWPFLFLRPAPDARIGPTTTLSLAALYGGLFGVLANVIAATAEAALPFDHAAAWPLMTFALMFGVLTFPLAWAWNRRALRLARRTAWAEKQKIQSLPAKDAKRDDEAEYAPEREHH